VQLLHEYLVSPESISVRDDLECVDLSCRIATSILSWEFASLGIKMAGSFENLPSADQPRAQGVFPESWASILVRSDVIDMFFQLSRLFQQNEHLRWSVDSCLEQLCCLHGPVLRNIEAEMSYLGHLFKSLTQHMSRYVVSLEQKRLNVSTNPRLASSIMTKIL
jgi:hypothetical protein